MSAVLFLREFRSALLRACDRVLRDPGTGGPQGVPLLCAHLEPLLRALQASLEPGGAEDPACFAPLAEAQAQALLAGQCTLAEVLAGYRRVRRCVLEVATAEGLAPGEVLALGEALARASDAVVERYATLRDAHLARTERLNATIAENATLGLVMMDARQHCVAMNRAAERIFGFTLAEVRGRPLHHFIHHTRPDGTPYPMEECPIDRALPQRAREQGEEVFVRRDGTFYPVAFTASPILEDGVPVGTVIEVRDLTEERRAREDRERLLAKLRGAVRVRDEFLSVASHELRTPLTTLGLIADGLVTLVERGQLAAQEPARLGAWAQRVRTQVDRLERLVQELLDVSRIASGQLEVRPVQVDLVATVRDVVHRFGGEAERRASLLTLSAAAQVEGWWDRQQLEQVLTQLLSNALKYGAGRPVEVRVEAAPDRARISVRDQGIGIAPQDQARIFGRFERAVSERNYGGLGLGLWVSRQIVEAHGGTIRVESQPGQGATFTVELPR